MSFNLSLGIILKQLSLILSILPYAKVKIQAVCIHSKIYVLKLALHQRVFSVSGVLLRVKINHKKILPSCVYIYLSQYKTSLLSFYSFLALLAPLVILPAPLSLVDSSSSFTRTSWKSSLLMIFLYSFSSQVGANSENASMMEALSLSVR